MVFTGVPACRQQFRLIHVTKNVQKIYIWMTSSPVDAKYSRPHCSRTEKGCGQREEEI